MLRIFSRYFGLGPPSYSENLQLEMPELPPKRPKKTSLDNKITKNPVKKRIRLVQHRR